MIAPLCNLCGHTGNPLLAKQTVITAWYVFYQEIMGLLAIGSVIIFLVTHISIKKAMYPEETVPAKSLFGSKGRDREEHE